MKAAPERVRRASLEENMSLSGWLEDIVKNKYDPSTDPKQRYLDLEEHPLPPPEDQVEEDDYEPSVMGEDEMKRLGITYNPNPLPPGPKPTKRYYGKQAQDMEDFEDRGLEDAKRMRLPDEVRVPDGHQPGSEDLPLSGHLQPDGQLRHSGQHPDSTVPWDDTVYPPGDLLQPSEEVEGHPVGMKRDHEDEGWQPVDRPSKRSRAEYLESYYMKVESLTKMRQKKEIRLPELDQRNKESFWKAMQKEIQNNITAGAYKILTTEESARVRQKYPNKIMESRFVLTAKPLEPQEVRDAEHQGLLLDWSSEEPCKAKARHVMKGFSEDGSSEIEATTPQVTREGSLMVTQLVVSHQWKLGFLDRIIYAAQPREGIPGMSPGQLLKLEKFAADLWMDPWPGSST